MAIFGGTFDPIHVGHLRTAFELWQALHLTEVRFLPTGNPPHRSETRANAELRLAMVRAAVEGQAGFVVDDREVRRTGLSYSVDTLTELRQENPDRSLCVLMGMDAFLGLPNWHRWREVLDLAHIVVVHRPGWRAPAQGPLGEVMVDRGTGSVRDLHTRLAGERLRSCPDPARDLVHGTARADRGGARSAVSGSDPVRRIILETGCYAQRGR